MMKNLFLAATIAALTCAGCAKEEAPAGPEDLAVKFSTEIATITRGVPVEGVQFGNGAKIGVFATEALGATSNAEWMNNVCLTRDASGKWTYDNLLYFMAGYKYSFVAYSPYTEQAPVVTDLTAVPYKVPTTLADQKDFLYSNSVAMDFTSKAPSSTDVVKFTFDHALAQVKFSALTEKNYSAYTLKITKISIAGISSEGKVNFSDGTWKDLAVPLTYELTLDDLALTTEKQSLTSGNDVLMLIPQNPEGKVLTLTVDIKATAAGNSALDGTKEISVNIPAGAWVSRHVYDYKITLNLDQTLGSTAGISDPSITEWGASEEIQVPVKK